MGSERRETLEPRPDAAGNLEATYVPTREPAAPSGPKARYDANVAAIRLIRQLDQDQRPATPQEQTVLARWSGWGAIPQVFDADKPDWASEHRELRELLNDDEYAQARRTVLNAHYTDPAYVAATWDALGRLGFEGGRVLEPGAGSGTFIGLAPEGADMTGVELDTMTAHIAQALYPRATVRAESFADTPFSSDHFDAAVGNVPFADLVVHDPIDNPNRHSLHDYFILKSLRLTRPGGVVAVLTSRYTLDKASPAARREMSQYADLIGAVRLPSGAHRRTAGTEAVTDLLILRKREPGTYPADRLWEGVTARSDDGEIYKVNSYFDAHPENVLGTMQLGHGMHGIRTLQVIGDLATVPQQLESALEQIVTDAHAHQLTITPRSGLAPEAPDPVVLDEWDGTIHATGPNSFEVTRGGVREPFAVPKSATRELTALLRIRDLAVTQLDLERGSLSDTEEIIDNRAALRSAWSAYVDRYGPINRFTESPTGRTNDEGEPIMARRTPTATRLLRSDPFGPVVLALEVFDESTQEVEPAALIERRVVTPRPQKLGADTPLEALQLSLDHSAKPDLDYMAGLLGETPEATREALGTLVFDDPESGALVTRAEYLSGNVRIKLEQATAAAESDPLYSVNVDALREAMPEELTQEDITAAIGAVWIDGDTHQAFLRELISDQNVIVESPMPGAWNVYGGTRHGVRATVEWGTSRRPAHDLYQSLLSQSTIRVTDTVKQADGTERQVLNVAATTEALQKASEIRERFEEWVWEDPDRAKRLTAEYNRRFNSIALRDYSTEGEHLTFPGMAASFQLRPHQKAAVARMLSEPAVGLFHQVGAGKTAEMVAGSMELRRLGLVNKAAVVVPNHMLEQFTREWMQIYPQARILAANSDTLAGDRRREFVARAAANDWDAVIMTREAFRRLAVGKDTETAYYVRQRALYQEGLDLAQNSGMDSRTVKNLEKALARFDEQFKARMDVERDPGITLEATGIDYLIVDEFHDYKNLRTDSSIPDANIPGSARATDMDMKLTYLRDKNPERFATVATATPIANSITEAHVMQRYLRPDLLREAGVEVFDAWAATFGQTVTEMEMAPQGGGTFRQKTRFAKFRNVPEMLRMWRVFADVKTAEDLNLPTPALKMRADGQRLPETIVLPAPPEVLEYVDKLGDRADKVQQRLVSPEEDNMLAISTDGRKAATDIRLVDPTIQPLHVPLDDIADNIAKIHIEHANDQYVDTRTGEPSSRPGALQLVFCDLGTPNPDRWNVYDELTDKLAARGIPRDRIARIHDARNDREKAALFSRAREGHISVLVGSTQRMGMGTNVQARTIALHDLDCPWRPADVEQRHGRILRQGNQNDEVQIVQYVTEGTFAAYMWQAIERKSRFINQVMRGRLDIREIDDLGADSLSAAEAKALASGNPLLLERSTALNELGRLERLESAWRRTRGSLNSTITQADRTIAQAEAEIAALEQAKTRARDLHGDRFHMTVNGNHQPTRRDAADAIAYWARSSSLQYARPGQDYSRGKLGEIGGFAVHARTRTQLGQLVVELDLDGIPAAPIRVAPSDLTNGELGVVTRLENRVEGIDRLISLCHETIASAEATREDATRNRDRPFKHGDALDQARAHLASIDAQLAPEETEPAPEAKPPTAQPHAQPPAPVHAPAPSASAQLSR